MHMNHVPTAVKGRFNHLSHLVFDVVKTDIGWHSFNVIWSDDCGTTQLESSFDLDELDRQLLSFSEAAILDYLEEVRQASVSS
ncbi:MAG TPA: hypothetical protein PKL46_14025 [Aquabacterium sp.]|nr:hypothetical protein [Aquabacterium sp.]